FFFFQAEDGIRDFHVTGVQTCALPILILLEYYRKLEIDNHTIKMRRLFTCVIVLLHILPFRGLAQSGPGGVSNDANPMKNCRLWLDAGDLASPSQLDGSEVHLWVDKS